MAPVQSFLEDLSPANDDLQKLCAILEMQAAEPHFGGVKLDHSSAWSDQKTGLIRLLEEKTEGSIERALQILAKITDTLELYAPVLKGLQDVHGFTTEYLEKLVFDQNIAEKWSGTAAYLYGQSMGMSTTTAEGIPLALETVLLRQDVHGANIALCILLGVERSNTTLFEGHLATLLRQVQLAAFSAPNKAIPREALYSAMKTYSPSQKAASCTLILRSVLALLCASLQLCEVTHTRCMGVEWVCFILEYMPMSLRLDIQRTHQNTVTPSHIFHTLSLTFPHCRPSAKKALCAALPVLTTWSTPDFVAGPQIAQSVSYMLGLTAIEGLKVDAFEGLGGLSNVVLDRFEPFLADVGRVALDALRDGTRPEEQAAAQRLLKRLLAALGPITLEIMVEYLRSPPCILLADVTLLEGIASLLPKLARRIIQTLTEIIDDLVCGKAGGYRHESVLEALNVFPLDDITVPSCLTDTTPKSKNAALTAEPELAQKAQKLVLWSLDEEKGKEAVLAALQLAINPFIATGNVVQSLTFRAAQLLLADDPHIVHLSLNVLSNPALASMLDERSCSMILLALHQSLEPSIQIVAAKLLTHLTTAHRAIVQPLAWSHIRQSLSLMDFLKSVDPTRAIIEACIISNLLPALPQSLHKKYVGPVKQLILSGLNPSPDHNATLSLVFQGLANLAKFEGWGAAQQSNLAMDLLEMTQEIPKDSQHAALNAISRLLSVPTEGLDVYDLLIRVHATFGGGDRGGRKMDVDLKSLVSGIYGHLGTVERNPVISRDSKAAINREMSVYTPKSHLLSQVAEVRDKHSADSQTHVNWLVTKNLLASIAPGHKSLQERSLVLEVMTAFGILQPNTIAALVPDLPQLLFAELRSALHPRDGARERDVTPVSAGILFLAASLHIHQGWLSTYWSEGAEVMADALKEGEVLRVLRGLGVLLDAIVE